MSTATRSEDWIKTQGWDIWVNDSAGQPQLVTSADMLLSYLQMTRAPKERQRAAVARFAALLAFRAAPSMLKRELIHLGYLTPRRRTS